MKHIPKSINFDFDIIFFDFSMSFILYTDKNKKQKYDVVFHQIKNNIKRFILYFSQFFSKIEIKY